MNIATLIQMLSKVINWIIDAEHTIGSDKLSWVLSVILGYLGNAFKLPLTSGRKKVWTAWINSTVALINLEVWHKATQEDYDEVHAVKNDALENDTSK